MSFCLWRMITLLYRALHAVDLLSHLIFAALLLHYVLYPPERPHTMHNDLEYVQARELAIIIWSFATTFRPWSAFQPAAFLSLVAFLVALGFKTVPLPGDGTFNALLLGSCIAIFYLFAPLSPNPLLLLSPARTLPISVLFANGSSKIVSPTILYFTPLFLICFILLSISLQGTFFAQPTIVLSQIPPEQTRDAFLLLLFALVFMVMFSFLVLITTTTSSQSDSVSWDCYNKATGKMARRTFFGVVVLYVKYLSYPVPFNLLQLILITLPTAMWQKITNSGHRSAVLKGVDRVFWFVLVGPLVIVASIGLYMIPVD
jgi:hypothetical protein